MAIPKVIHYCWFGQNPLPAQVRCCIDSWKKYCPDYKIIQWNESNFDVNSIAYTREAYAAKKWAFVSDYARLKIVYENGGIYLDTDVELVRSLDPLLHLDGFMGFQEPSLAATGLGFGAIRRHPAIYAMMSDYDDLSFFRPDHTMDTTPCPDRNTACLIRLGLKPDGTYQTVQGLTILPSDYLCPKSYQTGKTVLTENTYSIHHYQASWLPPNEIRWMKFRQLSGDKIYFFVRQTWNRIKKIFRFFIKA